MYGKVNKLNKDWIKTLRNSEQLKNLRVEGSSKNLQKLSVQQLSQVSGQVCHSPVTISIPGHCYNTQWSAPLQFYGHAALFNELTKDLSTLWERLLIKNILKLKLVTKMFYLPQIHEKNIRVQDVKDHRLFNICIMAPKNIEMSSLTHCGRINDTFLSCINVLVLIFITEICSCIFKELEIVQHRGRIR